MTTTESSPMSKKLTLKPRNEHDRSNYNLGHGWWCGIFKSIICTPTVLFWYRELERQHISICVDHVYSFEREIKDTTDTCRCALLSKLTVWVGYERGKKDDFNSPIVNFPFIYNNISVPPVYKVHSSQIFQSLWLL